MRVGKIRLKVRGLDAVSGFYRNVLGLTVLANDDRGATLGTGNTSLVVLKADAGLAPRYRRQTGLFHTAFLMPTRRSRSLAGPPCRGARAGTNMAESAATV